MRRTVSFLCFLIVTATVAQVEKPLKIDSFDRISCSDIRFRLDNFLSELFGDPNSVGIVVLGDDKGFSKAVKRRGLIENHFNVRKFDMSRIHFVRKSGIPEWGVELWKSRGSTELPFTFASEWSYKVAEEKKPFIVYSGGYNASECYFPSGGHILSEYLKANPGSRGNVVIRCNRVKCLSEQKKMILDELGQERDLVKTRIRFFYVPIRTEYFGTELWLLP